MGVLDEIKAISAPSWDWAWAWAELGNMSLDKLENGDELKYEGGLK